jgi:hypothetical protein
LQFRHPTRIRGKKKVDNAKGFKKVEKQTTIKQDEKKKE